MYTKLNLLPAKIAPKEHFKDAFRYTMFDGSRSLATDSFRLLEVTAIDGEKTTPVFLDSSVVKKHKVTKGVTQFLLDEISEATPKTDIDFPDVDRVIAEKEDVDYLEIKVNGELLGELLKIMSEVNKYKRVTLRIPQNKPNEAIHLYADTANYDHEKPTQIAHGLFMPLYRS